MKKYRNEAMKVVHEQAAYFFSKGIINAAEMKEYDEGCLVSPTLASTPPATQQPAMSAASPGPRGRSTK
jgi:DNA-binding transcriptional regulator YiaG